MRVESSLGDEIEKYLEKSGMSLTEFVRRACREKLDRDSGAHAEPQNNNYVTRAELDDCKNDIMKKISEMMVNSSTSINQSGNKNKATVKK